MGFSSVVSAALLNAALAVRPMATAFFMAYMAGAIVEKLGTQAKICAVWSNFFIGSTRTVCE